MVSEDFRERVRTAYERGRKNEVQDRMVPRVVILLPGPVLNKNFSQTTIYS